MGNVYSDLLPDDGYSGRIDDLPGFNDYIGSTSAFSEYLKELKQGMPKGANITGALNLKLKALWRQAGIPQMTDYVFNSVDAKDVTIGENTRISSNPINYDIWYLYWAGNILLHGKPSDYDEDEWNAKTLEKLEDFIKIIDSSEQLKCLKQPAQDRNTVNEDGLNTFTALSKTMGKDMTSGWKYAIKEARFETLIKYIGITNAVILGSFTANNQPQWPSTNGVYDSITNPPDPLYGPKRPDNDEYCGYIAFPVGPLGVMWRISFVTESSLDTSFSTGANVFPAADAAATVQYGCALLPPFDQGFDEIAGERLIDKGYVIADNSIVEIESEPFDGVDDYPLHDWMRYWIRKDNTTIIPGELCCLLVRPWALHCWYYQESSPLLYAGNWVETEFYASGIVKSVLSPWEEDGSMPSQNDTLEEAFYDPDNMDFKIGSKLYRVWVKNEEIIVESSDFKEYAVGDRVGLLKCVRDRDETNHINAVGPVDEGENTENNFDWRGLKWWKLKGRNTPDEDIYIRDWVVVPVDFYGATGGNTLGG